MKEIIRLENVSRTYHTGSEELNALKNVNLKIGSGEFVAVIGQSGSGKSTLMKVLSGVYPYGTYDGKIIYLGEEVKFKNIKESPSMNYLSEAST